MRKQINILEYYRALPQFQPIKLTRADQLGMDEESPLHLACFQGRVTDVIEMLKTDINIDIGGDIGCSPLHEAVLGGHADIVNILIKNGAEIDLVNDYDETPSDLAKTTHNREIISILKKAKNQ